MPTTATTGLESPKGTFGCGTFGDSETATDAFKDTLANNLQGASDPAAVR